jgi:hypothetical protein
LFIKAQQHRSFRTWPSELRYCGKAVSEPVDKLQSFSPVKESGFHRFSLWMNGDKISFSGLILFFRANNIPPSTLIMDHCKSHPATVDLGYR